MEIEQFPVIAQDAPVAVVTGGGRGIGRACALRLAQAGMQVAVLARSLDEVDEVAGLIHAGGGRSMSAVCDVAQPQSVARAVEAVVRRMGPAQVLVNNAGITGSVPFLKMDLEQWRAVLDVNLTGTFLMTRAVLPAMVSAGTGRIINVASTAGLTGFRYVAHYVASKHGVVGLTRALALEVASKGVTVNAVCPGWVDTDMLAASVATVAEKTGKGTAQAQAALLARVPQGTAVPPRAVAELVAYLASEAAAHITGAALALDGGETAGVF